MRVRVCPLMRAPLGAQKPAFLFAHLIVALSCLSVLAGTAAAQDVVIYSTDVSTIQGNWARVSSASGADASKLVSGDWGWATIEAPRASPGDYFEATFPAQAWTQYRVWLRLRAAGDSKWNDSVWVQFSDSHDAGGNAVYRIGTANGLLVNLESCMGCGVGAWGWTGGAWWVDQPTTVQFSSSGTKTLRVQTREDGVEVDQIVLSASTYRHSAPGSSAWDNTIVPRSGGSTATQTIASTPTETVRAIPGLIEAEDFDTGANGTAYWDGSAGNSGGQYRSTDVDIEGCSEGGFNVGWIGSGEWLNYTVSVPTAGNYTLEFRVASPGGGGALRADFGGENKTGWVAVPATGGWQSWTTVRKSVSLSAGVQVMRLVFDTGGFNVNYVNVVAGSTASSSAPSSASPTPFGGTPWSLPGTVQTEDFDNGGPGVAYYDNSPGNTGGAYRSTDVDIETTPNGGHNVGWVGAGEWLRYTVNVTQAGHYALTARVASAGGGGTFHVEFNGSDVTGAMRVPNTGGWQTYQDVNATVWLDAGEQAMRLVFDSNGATGAVGNFTFLRLSQDSVEVAAAPAPAPSSGNGGRVRVMTWNIHFGNGDTWGQAQEIASSGADVVLLQEAQTWDEHFPTTYRDRLSQMTGQTWYTVWAGGPDCTYGCQGTLILSRFPIVDSSTATFDGTPVGRALIDVGGVRINVFNVHLEYYDTSRRSSQLLQFMDWMRHFGGPRLAGGDFNSWWGEWWIGQMKTEYSDTWEDVQGTVEGGFTCCPGGVRFDYQFRAYQDSWRVTPTAIWVPWTSRSDHLPVIADYTVQ
jgi:endonuclease/exonuclease/phosphatase family metal-dependent hydrolase